jgi:hypothetical protein
LQRPEAERIVVELVERLIAEGGIDDRRAIAVIEAMRHVSPIWLVAAGGDRLPTRLVAGRGRR